MNIRSLYRMMESADKALSVVFIHLIIIIGFRMNRLSRLLIKLKNEDSSRPGSVYHPPPVVGILEHSRISGIGPELIVEGSPGDVALPCLYVIPHDLLKVCEL